MGITSYVNDTYNCGNAIATVAALSKSDRSKVILDVQSELESQT